MDFRMIMVAVYWGTPVVLLAWWGFIRRHQAAIAALAIWFAQAAYVLAMTLPCIIHQRGCEGRGFNARLALVVGAAYIGIACMLLKSARKAAEASDS